MTVETAKGDVDLVEERTEGCAKGPRGTLWPNGNDEQAIEIERGTGNVFADLGYPDAEERQTKLRLALRSMRSCRSRD